MCEMCQDICDSIADIFGHTVNPKALSQLIENSRLETCVDYNARIKREQGGK